MAIQKTDATVKAEKIIASNAQNLADWFGKNREISEHHTGSTLVESAYVQKCIDNIVKQFNILQAELFEDSIRGER